MRFYPLLSETIADMKLFLLFFFFLVPFFPRGVFLIVSPNKFQKKSQKATLRGTSADRRQVTERALLK